MRPASVFASIQPERRQLGEAGMPKIDDLLDGEIISLASNSEIRRVIEHGTSRMPLTASEVSLLRAALVHVAENAADFAPLIPRPSKPAPTAQHVRRRAHALLVHLLAGDVYDQEPHVAAWRARTLAHETFAERDAAAAFDEQLAAESRPKMRRPLDERTGPCRVARVPDQRELSLSPGSRRRVWRRAEWFTDLELNYDPSERPTLDETCEVLEKRNRRALRTLGSAAPKRGATYPLNVDESAPPKPRREPKTRGRDLKQLIRELPREVHRRGRTLESTAGAARASRAGAGCRARRRFPRARSRVATARRSRHGRLHMWRVRGVRPLLDKDRPRHAGDRAANGYSPAITAAPIESKPRTRAGRRV